MDLISRQAAIKAIENLHDCYNGFSDTYDKACIIGVLEEVPSVLKTGKWINNMNGTFTCDTCGCKHSRSNYCPNCGAYMKGE